MRGFKKIVVRYKKIGCNINVMRQTACLVVNYPSGGYYAHVAVSPGDHPLRQI